MQRRWLLVPLVTISAVSACGSDDGADTSGSSVLVSSTTSGDGDGPPSTSPAGGSVTIESIIASVQAVLDDKFASSDPPPGVLGAFELQCVDSGPVARGDVFACAGVPRTEPGFELDPVGVVFYVVDDSRTVAWLDGTDVPDTTSALVAEYESAPKGLFCRDLRSADAGASLFSAVGRRPADGFFWSLVYWSLEGQPDRMDADQNGIPCETLYEPDVVSAVLAGRSDA